MGSRQGILDGARQPQPAGALRTMDYPVVRPKIGLTLTAVRPAGEPNVYYIDALIDGVTRSLHLKVIDEDGSFVSLDEEAHLYEPCPFGNSA